MYTRPVSDTTRSSTWVPVRTDSSYAYGKLSVQFRDASIDSTIGCNAVREANVATRWRVTGVGRARSSHGMDVTDLLHDAGLALGEGDVSTRLVLDELDLNLASLATRLVVVIVVVVSRAGTRTLDASALEGAIAVLEVVGSGGRVGLVIGGDVGHCCGLVAAAAGNCGERLKEEWINGAQRGNRGCRLVS